MAARNARFGLDGLSQPLGALAREERLDAIGSGERQLETPARAEAAVAVVDQRAEGNVQADAATEVRHVLAIDVRVRGVVAEPGAIERPREIGRAIEARAAIAEHGAAELALEANARALERGGDAGASPHLLAAVLEAVAEHAARCEPSHDVVAQVARRRTGDETERRGMARRFDRLEQAVHAARVRVAARLHVVRQARGGLIRRRPARDPHQRAGGEPDQVLQELDQEIAGRIDRILGGAVAERRQTLVERRVRAALDPAAERVGRRVVDDLGCFARRRVPGRAGRRLPDDAVVLVHEVGERGAEVEQRPDAAIAARHGGPRRRRPGAERASWSRGRCPS